MRIGIISFGNLVNQNDSDVPGKPLLAKKPSLVAGGVFSDQFKIKENSPFVPTTNLELPIRLGRIANSGTQQRKLSLVLHQKASNERVFYTESKCTNLNDAIKNLREREGIAESDYENIGYVNLTEGKARSKHAEVATKIKNWARENHFDAVIWTDLPTKGINFDVNSTGREILPVLRGDSILLENTKQYIRNLPTTPNSLQRSILDMPSDSPSEVAYKKSLTADFEQRDAMAQTTTRREDWFHSSWGTWGPYAKAFPKVNVPQGYDKAQWKRDRIIEVAKHYTGLPYKREDGKRGHFPDRGCGLDCSNFASWVYNYGLGIQFTSDVDELWFGNEGRKLGPNEQPQKGDLVFFKGNPRHVVIYIDENHVIDSTSCRSEGVGVRNTLESKNAWCAPTKSNPRLLGFKRLIE